MTWSYPLKLFYGASLSQVTDGLGELLLQDLRDCFVHPLRRPPQDATLAAAESPSGDDVWNSTAAAVADSRGMGMLDVEDTRHELEALLDASKWLRLRPRNPTATSSIQLDTPYSGRGTENNVLADLEGRQGGAAPQMHVDGYSGQSQEEGGAAPRPIIPSPEIRSSRTSFAAPAVNGYEAQKLTAVMEVGYSESGGNLDLAHAESTAAAEPTNSVSFAAAGTVVRRSADPPTARRLDDLWHEALSPPGDPSTGNAANEGCPPERAAKASPLPLSQASSGGGPGTFAAFRASSLPASEPSAEGSKGVLKGSASIGRINRQLWVDVPSDHHLTESAATRVDGEDGASEWPAIKFLRATSSESSSCSPSEPSDPTLRQRAPLESEMLPSVSERVTLTHEPPALPDNGYKGLSQIGSTATTSGGAGVGSATSKARGSDVGSITSKTATLLHGSPADKPRAQTHIGGYSGPSTEAAVGSKAGNPGVKLNGNDRRKLGGTFPPRPPLVQNFDGSNTGKPPHLPMSVGPGNGPQQAVPIADFFHGHGGDLVQQIADRGSLGESGGRSSRDSMKKRSSAPLLPLPLAGSALPRKSVDGAVLGKSRPGWGMNHTPSRKLDKAVPDRGDAGKNTASHGPDSSPVTTNFLFSRSDPR